MLAIQNCNEGPTGQPLFAEPRYLAHAGGDVPAIWTPFIEMALTFPNEDAARGACSGWHPSYVEDFKFVEVHDGKIAE